MYDAVVARRERIYQGELENPAGTTFYGEVWTNGAVAIVFRSPHNQSLAVLSNPTVGMVGENGAARLSVTGFNEEAGVEQTWLAHPAEQQILNWLNVKVRYPDGEITEGATVQATQYRVTVLKAGKEPRVFIGATATIQYGQRRINTVDGESIIVETKAGCGCGK